MLVIRTSTSREPSHFERDRERHRKKILQLLRANPENLEELIAEEDIIRMSPDQAIKVSVRGLIEYQFVFDPDRSPQVGQNASGGKKGDLVKTGERVPGQQGLQGPGAGDTPGIDVYETEILVKELRELIDEILELPHLEEKSRDKIETVRRRGFQGTKKVGIRPHLDKRKTLKEKMKREKDAERKRKGRETLP